MLLLILQYTSRENTCVHSDGRTTPWDPPGDTYPQHPTATQCHTCKHAEFRVLSYLRSGVYCRAASSAARPLSAQMCCSPAAHQMLHVVQIFS